MAAFGEIGECCDRGTIDWQSIRWQAKLVVGVYRVGHVRPLAHPLLHEALKEQLGLELRTVKNVPVDVVVLDSANKEPTEN